jgi:hypothetical protein
MYHGRTQICFAKHLFSLLCESYYHVIHRDTGLDNNYTGLRRSSSDQLASDHFGEIVFHPHILRWRTKCPESGLYKLPSGIPFAQSPAASEYRQDGLYEAVLLETEKPSFGGDGAASLNGGASCHFPQISDISSSINVLNIRTYSKFIWPSIPQIFGLTVLIIINIQVALYPLFL